MSFRRHLLVLSILTASCSTPSPSGTAHKSAALGDTSIGLRSIHHFGITVPDLSQAVDFFTSIGCTAVDSPVGPLDNAALVRGYGHGMMDTLNVSDATVIDRFQFVSCGSTYIEVFKYTASPQSTSIPRNSDIGGQHIAFAVDDICAASATLKRAGHTVLAGPNFNGSGPVRRWIYVNSPWGLQLELVEARAGSDTSQPAPCAADEEPEEEPEG
jgi:catechol 2,3-dioxygenase-like lactoylglutathione lyase family enzyme